MVSSQQNTRRALLCSYHLGTPDKTMHASPHMPFRQHHLPTPLSAVHISTTMLALQPCNMRYCLTSPDSRLALTYPDCALPAHDLFRSSLFYNINPRIQSPQVDYAPRHARQAAFQARRFMDRSSFASSESSPDASDSLKSGSLSSSCRKHPLQGLIRGY